MNAPRRQRFEAPLTTLPVMCAQCVATGAVAATTAATGARVWLAARSPAWFTPAVKRRVSVLLVVAGVLAAGALSGGGGDKPAAAGTGTDRAFVAAMAEPFDRAFLGMMIPRHEGAVTMAETELDSA